MNTITFYHIESSNVTIYRDIINIHRAKTDNAANAFADVAILREFSQSTVMRVLTHTEYLKQTRQRFLPRRATVISKIKPANMIKQRAIWSSCHRWLEDPLSEFLHKLIMKCKKPGLRHGHGRIQ